MIRGFFREDDRTEWNVKLYDYFTGKSEATIEDYFGIWNHLVREYGPSRYPDEPLSFQDCRHPFSFRKITRRGAIYYPLILLYEEVPLYHRTVTSTILPIQVQYLIAEALGATLNEEKGTWIAPHVNQKLWEDWLVMLIFEYEMYIMLKVMTDLDSIETLVMLNGMDNAYFMR